MTTLKQEKGLIRNTASMLLVYTLLFGVLIGGIFFTFIMERRSILINLDAYDQVYFWIVELKRQLAGMLAGEGFPGWSWSRGFGMDVKLPSDPFFLIAALFPIGHIELGYSVANVLKLYLCGLTFISFAREVKLGRYEAVMGGICYAFSTWVFNTSLFQTTVVTIAIVFPLIIQGAERIYKGKSPVMFIITVALAMINSVYMAYMAALGTVMFILLRYAAHCEKFSIKDYALKLLSFIGYGLAGIMLSGLWSVNTIKSLLGASTGGGVEQNPAMHPDLEAIISLGDKLVSDGFNLGYGDVGIPILALMVVLVSLRYFSIKKTELILSGVLLLMYLTPYCSSVFNGFGYVSKRWLFVMVFFLIWAAAESFDLDKLAEPLNLVLLTLGFALVVGSTVGLKFMNLTGDYTRRQYLFVFAQMLGGAVMYLIIASGFRNKVPLTLRQCGVTLVTACVLIYAWNASFEYNAKRFVLDNQINDSLEHSVQRAGALIDDDGFYRIDQVDGINYHKTSEHPSNENLWWNTKTLYVYDSKVPSKQSEFNRLLGNNYGYSKRVYLQSNGNRMGLDFLSGVKYFLGNDLRNDETGSDEYAGYGFKLYKNIDGVNVFKNRYDSGLGFVYDKVITRSEFEKLSRNAREQAVLQAMVVPDEAVGDTVSESRVITAKDIKVDIDDIRYTVVAEDGAHLDGDTIVVDEREDDESDASFTIHVDGVNRSQMVVSFDNLRRFDAETGEEVGDFAIACKNKKLKSIANNKRSNQSIANITDFDMNMGYYDSYSGNLKLSFTKPGSYSFDKLYVSAMSAANYDKYASERMADDFKVDSYGDEFVEGTVDTKDGGYVFLSIPLHSNWTIYVDGEEQEKIEDANIAYVAAAVPQGEHTVRLEYSSRGKLVSAGLSVAGLLITLLCHAAYRRKKHNNK